MPGYTPCQIPCQVLGVRRRHDPRKKKKKNGEICARAEAEAATVKAKRAKELVHTAHHVVEKVGEGAIQ